MINLNDGANLQDPSKFTDAMNKKGNADGAAADGDQGAIKSDVKDLMTKTLEAVLMKLGDGRQNVPAYNMHEARGMTGLTTPGIVQQATYLPVPFDKTFDKTANLLGIVNQLGMQRYQANNQIIGMVNQQIPQMAGALKQQDSLYQGVSENYYTNRVNIAMQRRREESIYAFV